MIKIFISYSHNDTEWVTTWLLPRLENAGLQVHIDFRDFVIGTPILVNIREAVSKCDHTLLILTRNWVKSEWANFEALLLQTGDPRNLRRKVLPLLLEECVIPDELSVFTYADFRERDTWETEFSRLLTQLGVADTSPGRTGPVRVFTAKLPTTGKELFGRESELTMLDEAWEDEHVNVFTLTAWGGVGKTALVNEWLNQIGKDNYRGAERVYGWSFYSQGTREERQVSGDEFLSHALKWFGDNDSGEGSPWDKGIRLAELIRGQRTLLVLDGLEPLQHPPGEMQGYLRDQGVQALLKELARFNPGLCVVSTREAVKDIEHTFDRSTKQLFLENLSDQAGMQLLREMGVTKGSDEDLREASKEYGGHALALTLLGRQLAVRYHGDVSKRVEIDTLIHEVERVGKHSRRVMKSYEIWLEGKPELAVLHLMGLFDRPAGDTAMRALRQKPEIPGLTALLSDLSQADWDYAVEHLRDLRLLSAKDDSCPDTLDCHPLIREYFGESLRLSNVPAWQQAHSYLFEYYRNQPTKDQPDTLEEMAPLYAAVAHGCQAGRYQEALDEVFVDRIRRGTVHFSLFRLGAVGADLSALANFFERRFAEPVNDLDILGRAYVLNEVGSAFRILGRLNEAVEPVEKSFQIYFSRGDRQIDAARSARNLSKIHVQLGRLEDATKLAEQAVALASQSGRLEEQYISHANLGRVLHFIGRFGDAVRSFEKSKELRSEMEGGQEGQSSWRGRFTLQEAHYCDLLLEQGRTEEALCLLNSMPQATKEVLGLLDYALYHYSYGRTVLIQSQELDKGDNADAKNHLDEAIDNLRRVMRQDELGFAYLIRSSLYRSQGYFSLAQADLDAVREIAERSDICILFADCHLEACRLHLEQDEGEAAMEDFYKAKDLVEHMRYGRREKAVGELEQILKLG